jgi:hypothetical protein
MDACYAGWINYKKFNIQACILSGNCILYFYLNFLLEEKIKCENSVIGDMC